MVSVLLRINDVQILNPVKISRRPLSIAATYPMGVTISPGGNLFKLL